MKLSKGAIGASIGGMVGVAVAAWIGLGTPIVGGENSLWMRFVMVLGTFLGATLGGLAFHE